MLASSDAEGRLALYIDVLATWNARINLVGRGDSASLVGRHLADSLAVLALLPAWARRIVDLGAGAGLPGLPVAIATGIETHLVDRDQRKCAFLREAGRRTGAPVAVHEADFALLAPVGADIVLSRATATLPLLLDAAGRHARKGGTMLFHKSESQSGEIESARARWFFAVQVLPNPADPRGRIWRISGLARRNG